MIESVAAEDQADERDVRPVLAVVWVAFAAAAGRRRPATAAAAAAAAAAFVEARLEGGR